MIDAVELGLSGLVYQAGSVAPAGRYRRIDAPGREIELTSRGPLPPSFDGRVALYAPVAARVEGGL